MPKVFIKRQLNVPATNAEEFGPRRRNRSGTSARRTEMPEFEEFFFDDGFMIEREEEIEWYDEGGLE